MAIEVYPGDIPTVDKDGTNSVAPTTAVQDDGYPTSSEPPSSEHNYIFNRSLRALLSSRQKPIKDWITATVYEEFELVINPDTPRKLYQTNVAHTSTGTTLKENDLSKWDIISESLDDLLGPFVNGDMVVGDTGTGNLKKSTVVGEVGALLSQDPGIINGNMQFWQTNTTRVAAPSGTFFADLFKYTSAGPQEHTISRDTDAPDVPIDGAEAGANFSILLNVTTANTGLDATELTLFDYAMEGLDFAPYFGKTFTLSFFVKSDVTGLYAVSFRNGAFDRSFVAEYTIDVVDTWEKKVVTILHDTTGTWNLDQNLGMTIGWALAGGSQFQTTPGSWQNGNFFTTSTITPNPPVNIDLDTGNKFRLAQVKMNLGSIEINNLKSDSHEFARIPRYFRRLRTLLYGFHSDGNNEEFRYSIALQNSMRANPLVTFVVNSTGGAISDPFFSPVTNDAIGFVIESTSAASQNAFINFDLFLDSRF